MTETQIPAIHCMRCYELAKIINDYAKGDRRIFLTNDQLWQARTEALQGIERMVSTHNSNPNVGEALDACRNCEYKSPGICDVFYPKVILD